MTVKKCNIPGLVLGKSTINYIFWQKRNYMTYLITSPKKCLCHLDLKCDMSENSFHTKTNFWNYSPTELHLYICLIVPDYKARSQ